MSKSNPSGVKLARDLKIGDRFGTTRTGEPVYIKRLHELCSQLMLPHVHVVTTAEVKCLGFNYHV